MARTAAAGWIMVAVWDAALVVALGWRPAALAGGEAAGARAPRSPKGTPPVAAPASPPGGPAAVV